VLLPAERACSGGTYAPLSSRSCLPCPPGHYCPSVASALIYPCAIGTYATGNASQCSICPAGKACPLRTQAVLQSCASGTYSYQGQGNCTVCPAGKSCTTTGTLQDCLPGSYSPEGYATCDSCTAGNYCPYTTLAVVIPCAPGTYSLANADSCHSCPSGWACSSTSAGPNIQCQTGTFSTGNQASCTSCLAGYYCTSTTSNVMTPCPTGWYSMTGASECEECPAGSYCPTRSSLPIQCSAGSYSANGATSCTLADPGHYVALPGASQQNPCGVGTYSTGGATGCLSCSPGYRCPSLSTEPSPASASCPMGFYCNPPSAAPVGCMAGTYGIVTAGTSQADACVACEPGYLCASVGTVLATRQVCPHGGYCPGSSSAIVPCDPGYKSSKTGQTSVSTCEPCDAGTYCTHFGTVNGTVCPPHYYCPAGTADYTQFACPPGTYSLQSGLHSASQCMNCTVGHYCTGASDPQPCAQGTYNPSFAGSSSSSCLPCEAGYACPRAGMSKMDTPCAAGHYCTPNTVNPSQRSCPLGTYTDSVSLTAPSGCTNCTAGYTCGLGITSSLRGDCALGHYCPARTATGGDLPCPAGTYSSTPHLTSASECSPCLPGSYCSGGGTAVTGPCAAGHYCPAKTATDTAYPCPAGTYTNRTDLYSAAQCTTCAAGHYCAAGATLQTKCPVGTYAPQARTNSSSGCLDCPAGYYCTASTVTPMECGAGYYSDTRSGSCAVCPRGTYCSSNTTSDTALVTGGGSWSNYGDLSGVCFNGTICDTPGMARVPDLLRDACPAGYYCPAGVPFPLSCPAGHYNPSTGQDALSDCLPTPAGYWSAANSTAVLHMCAPGYYCGLRSTSKYQTPCPARTYLPEYGGAAVSDCALCPAGFYCPQGTATPHICTRGHYCVTGLSTPLSCVPGTYGNATGLTSIDECTRCDGGSYCDGYNMTAPRGLCNKGYYCISGSNTSTPHYLVDTPATNLSYFGGICPVGHYCETGSILPQACPAGTFNNKIGSDSPSDCVSCPGGFYCQGTGNKTPTGKCTAGYYCTGNSSVATQFESQPGYYSTTGSSNQTACPPTTYNMEHRKSHCDTCPAGFYCPISGLRNYTAYMCPPGRYCPPGTDNPYRCPAGTFSPLYGLINVTQCTPCTTGNYCEFDGLTEVTDPCDAGYYCTLAATTRNPTSGTGGPCTPGHYCQAGSGAPVPCPRGTYMPSVRNVGQTYFNGTNYFCNLCPNGFACDGIALTNYTSQISAGYWGRIGAPSATPICAEANCTDMYGICPTGAHCVKKSTQPVACPAGYYQDQEGQASCKVSTALCAWSSVGIMFCFSTDVSRRLVL
jgi:hypothetical protein